MKKILRKKCKVCKSIYQKKAWTSWKNWKLSKYCSSACQAKFWTGKSSRHQGKNKNPAWNKGIPGIKGEKNPSWKGNNAGYSAKHKWVESLLGRPEQCEQCGKDGLTKQQIHWANMDHKYKRNLKDWKRWCASCHFKYDRNKFK